MNGETQALMMKALRCCARVNGSCTGCPAEAMEDCVSHVLRAALETIDTQGSMLAQLSADRAALSSALIQAQRELADALRSIAEADA